MSNAEIMSGYTFQALGRSQEARVAIEALEARIAELEARLALLPELEARLGKLDADVRGLAKPPASA